jgi:hypothetical protein
MHAEFWLGNLLTNDHSEEDEMSLTGMHKSGRWVKWISSKRC